MIQLTNQPVNAAVTLTTKISTTTLPTDLALYRNGVFVTSSIQFLNVTLSGLANFTFTPTSTGVYTLYGDAAILATVEVVSRTLQDYLKNIEDEAVGSWSWNKTTGSLTLLRQDGTTLHTYVVVDDLTTSSRELIS